jgi:hypothetical protein
MHAYTTEHPTKARRDQVENFSRRDKRRIDSRKKWTRKKGWDGRGRRDGMRKKRWIRGLENATQSARRRIRVAEDRWIQQEDAAEDV